MSKIKKFQLKHLFGPMIPPYLLGLKNSSELIKKSPFLRKAYDIGKSEGKQEGYCDASVVFEKKLRSQILDFLEKEKNHASDTLELEKLLIEMENFIEYLTSQTAVSKVDQSKLEEAFLLDLKSIK